MNTIDLLLKMDAGKLEKPKKDIEIKRLSEIMGKPMHFTCQALDSEQYNAIQEDAIQFGKNGKLSKIDMSYMQLYTILDGVVQPNLRDADLLKHFSCSTPLDLIKKLLLPGEITNLFNIINELSGFADNTVDEQVDDIKN